MVGAGLDLKESSNLVSDNLIQASSPITMDLADSNTIARNTISGPISAGQNQNRVSGEGIALFTNCSDNLIFENNITGFLNQAFRTVFNCTNNTVSGNYLANNGFAIALQEGAVNNTFYGNTFMADSCQIQIDDGVDGTRWDKGTVGNFWGDYNGTDNDDGIGDTPYLVYGYIWSQKTDGFVE